jgi:hypothetical protein
MKKYQKSTTVMERAKLILSLNQVTHVPQQKCFVATDSSGEKHLVRLFRDGKPSQHCTCASTVTCSHIMAAMISIDYEYHPRNEKPNLTRYRKNVNKRADSRSGTKKKSKPSNGYGNIRRKEAQVPTSSIIV